MNIPAPHIPALTAMTLWEQHHCKHLQLMAWVPWKQLSEYARELEDQYPNLLTPAKCPNRTE